MNKTLEQEIDCLKIKNKGIQSEFDYIINLKEKEIISLNENIVELNEKNLKLKRKIDELFEKNKEINEELEQKKQIIVSIENSRWWKIRNFVKKYIK